VDFDAGAKVSVLFGLAVRNLESDSFQGCIQGQNSRSHFKTQAQGSIPCRCKILDRNPHNWTGSTLLLCATNMVEFVDTLGGQYIHMRFVANVCDKMSGISFTWVVVLDTLEKGGVASVPPTTNDVRRSQSLMCQLGSGVWNLESRWSPRRPNF
jgi:hypothetical protein